MTGAFNRRTVLALVLFGALTFVAMLWFIGHGDTGPGADNGEAHAASHGVTGYSGLVELLQRQGYDVSLSRSPQHYRDEALLVLTPPPFADADDIEKIVDARRYDGPTLLILPKWFASRPPMLTKGAKKGWVVLNGAMAPQWPSELDQELKMKVALAKAKPGSADWQGLGLSGSLPRRDAMLGLEEGPYASLVRDGAGRDLVAYADDHGCYPVLDEAAGYAPPDQKDCDSDKWNLTVVFEPDLFDNYGMADRNRALLASRVVELAREEQNVPIVFDLTLAGLGGAKNLLTLAFTPPFLAATVCLLLALVLVGWRAFARFGPPLSEPREIALGKAQLAANAGGFVRRSGRLHLLAAPYAALVARRLASALGLRRADSEAIDAALAARDPAAAHYSELARRLETARRPSDILRAAHALKSLERTAQR